MSAQEKRLLPNTGTDRGYNVSVRESAILAPAAILRQNEYGSRVVTNWGSGSRCVCAHAQRVCVCARTHTPRALRRFAACESEGVGALLLLRVLRVRAKESL